MRGPAVHRGQATVRGLNCYPLFSPFSPLPVVFEVVPRELQQTGGGEAFMREYESRDNR